MSQFEIGTRYKSTKLHHRYNFQAATYYRIKIKLEFDKRKKMSPFASYENFFKFTDNNEFRGNRCGIGLHIGVDNKLDQKIFCGVDQEINTKDAIHSKLFEAPPFLPY